jgi:hypothetical protein
MRADGGQQLPSLPSPLPSDPRLLPGGDLFLVRAGPPPIVTHSHWTRIAACGSVDLALRCGLQFGLGVGLNDLLVGGSAVSFGLSAGARPRPFGGAAPG